jgi:hypothetical protein
MWITSRRDSTNGKTAGVAIGGWRMDNDRLYYARRAVQERAAAMRSTHSRVRQVHLQMAAAYEERLVEIGHREREGIHLVDVA